MLSPMLAAIEGFVFLLFLPLAFFLFLLYTVLAIILGKAPESLATPERKEVWNAMSDLYLDTEITELDIETLADAIRRGGFSKAEARKILETEVGPSCMPNMFSVAGEWAPGAFAGEWIIRNALASQPSANVVREIPLLGAVWAKIVTYGTKEHLENALRQLPNEGDLE